MASCDHRHRTNNNGLWFTGCNRTARCKAHACLLIYRPCRLLALRCNRAQQIRFGIFNLLSLCIRHCHSRRLRNRDSSSRLCWRSYRSKSLERARKAFAMGCHSIRWFLTCLCRYPANKRIYRKVLDLLSGLRKRINSNFDYGCSFICDRSVLLYPRNCSDVL